MKKDTIKDGVRENWVYDIGNPLVYQSLLDVMNNAEDILTYCQMLDTADKAECLKAQEPEIKGLEEMKVLAYLKKNMLPKNSKLLTAV